MDLANEFSPPLSLFFYQINKNGQNSHGRNFLVQGKVKSHPEDFQFQFRSRGPKGSALIHLVSRFTRNQCSCESVHRVSILGWLTRKTQTIHAVTRRQTQSWPFSATHFAEVYKITSENASIFYEAPPQWIINKPAVSYPPENNPLPHSSHKDESRHFYSSFLFLESLVKTLNNSLILANMFCLNPCRDIKCLGKDFIVSRTFPLLECTYIARKQKT